MLTKNWRFNRCALLSLLILLVVAGCGDGKVGSVEQCEGADVSGLCLAVVSLVPSFEEVELVSVDAFQNLDCEPDTETAEAEIFESHQVLAEFSLFNLIPTNIPGETQGVAAFVTINQYRIEYTPDEDNVPPAPPLTTREFRQTILVEVDELVEATLSLVDISQKIEFAAFSGSQDERFVRGENNPIHSYTAKYTFSGSDSLSNPVSAVGFAKFEMGNFDVCDLS